MDEKKIIQIASSTKYNELKNHYILRTKAKNKICGDEISIEVEKDFKNIRFETNSCIYTQASAAILANNFNKICNYGLANILKHIEKKLNGENIDLPLNIKELNFLINKKNKNRKECITLPFDAILKIIND
tara:strand:- start:946 stop:1338 length:393 start_codon:yes stop_codon:yes gene_type:complete